MAEIVKKVLPTPLSAQAKPQSVIESEVFDASRKARKILQDAQDEAARIILEAQTESVTLRDTAKCEGFEEGHAKGLRQYESQIIEINQKYDDLLAQAEEQLLGLAVGVAQKIIGRELKQNPNAIVAIVSQALAPMNQKRSISIRVNPADLSMLQAHRPQILEQMLQGGHVMFVPDADVSQGGCLIETEHGRVDARLETQLSSIHEILTGQKDAIFFESETIGEDILDVQDQEAETNSIVEHLPQGRFEPGEVQNGLSQKYNLKPAATDEKVDPQLLADLDQLAKDLQSGQSVTDLLSQLDAYLKDDNSDET